LPGSSGSFGLPPSTWTTLGNPDGVSRYLRFVQDAYVEGPVVGTSRCNCDFDVKPPLCQRSEVHSFEQRRWTKALSAASERFSGTLSMTPFARSGPTSDLGEGASSAVSFFGVAQY
jgi:hypothetical protein